MINTTDGTWLSTFNGYGGYSFYGADISWDNSYVAIVGGYYDNTPFLITADILSSQIIYAVNFGSSSTPIFNGYQGNSVRFNGDTPLVTMSGLFVSTVYIMGFPAMKTPSADYTFINSVCLTVSCG